jgi:hypothetical protein
MYFILKSRFLHLTNRQGVHHHEEIYVVYAIICMYRAERYYNNLKLRCHKLKHCVVYNVIYKSIYIKIFELKETYRTQ